MSFRTANAAISQLRLEIAVEAGRLLWARCGHALHKHGRGRQGGIAVTPACGYHFQAGF